MYLNGYSVRVPQGVERAHGYVHLNHGQQFTLVLGNKNTCRCNATVRLDGKEVGTWRLERGQTITLERPVNEAKLFTFYRADSTEGRHVAPDVSESNQGVLSVEFVPEDASFSLHTADVLGFEPSSMQGRGILRGVSFNAGVIGANTTCSTAGVSGLSGSSDQRFTRADHMKLDHGSRQTINLRLVCSPVSTDPTPLRPVGRQETPLPPPV